MEKKFKLTFQLDDDGETVTSTAIVTISKHERENDIEECESDESFVARKLKDVLENDGFGGVCIISTAEL